MSEPIKLSDEEISKIKKLQEQYQEKTFSFGQLYLEKMAVEKIIQSITDRESTLKEEWSALQNTEKSLIDEIIKKYGEGTLNLTHGTLTPDK